MLLSLIISMQLSTKIFFSHCGVEKKIKNGIVLPGDEKQPCFFI